MGAPKITLYTNHGCPFAHRAHIALKETGLEYEEVIIDLNKPREPWYLEINPVSDIAIQLLLFILLTSYDVYYEKQRGLVPTINYNGNIIPESGIVAQFIADAHPSHLLPPSSPVENSLYRARVAFFIDAFFSKAIAHFWPSLRTNSQEEKDSLAEQIQAGILKEVEPLLVEGKGPFFGGSDKLTLAEVCTFPF